MLPLPGLGSSDVWPCFEGAKRSGRAIESDHEMESRIRLRQQQSARREKGTGESWPTTRQLSFSYKHDFGRCVRLSATLRSQHEYSSTGEAEKRVRVKEEGERRSCATSFWSRPFCALFPLPPCLST